MNVLLLLLLLAAAAAADDDDSGLWRQCCCCCQTPHAIIQPTPASPPLSTPAPPPSFKRAPLQTRSPSCPVTVARRARRPACSAKRLSGHHFTTLNPHCYSSALLFTPLGSDRFGRKGVFRASDANLPENAKQLLANQVRGLGFRF